MKINSISRLLFFVLFLNCMNFGVSFSNPLFSSGVEKANIKAEKSFESVSKARKVVKKITVKDAITYTLISAALFAYIMQNLSISQRFFAMEGRVNYLEGRVKELLGPPPPYEPPSSS
ncbi:hypothetical protein E3J79_00475 [Candidatus Dependentiae bacterium]|nr:MAG: hypothetical protein E3J79_00475 [Candidatus Dependentiae bacterium]